MASKQRQSVRAELERLGIVRFPDDITTGQMDKLLAVYQVATENNLNGVHRISDDDLFKLLQAFGEKPGPIMPTTRDVYAGKLKRRLKQSGVPEMVSMENKGSNTSGVQPPSPVTPNGSGIAISPTATSTPKTPAKTPGPTSFGLFSSFMDSSGGSDGSSQHGNNVHSSLPPRQSRMFATEAPPRSANDFDIKSVPVMPPSTSGRRLTNVPAKPTNVVGGSYADHRNVLLSSPYHRRTEQLPSGGLLSQRPLPHTPESHLSSVGNIAVSCRQALSTGHRSQQSSPSTASMYYIQIAIAAAVGLLIFAAFLMMESNPSNPIA